MPGAGQEPERRPADAAPRSITRRALVRRGAAAGLGLPALGWLAAACGGGGKKDTTATTAAGTSAPDTTAAAPTTGGAGPTASSEATSPPTSTAEGGAISIEGVAPPSGQVIRVGLVAPSSPLDPLLLADHAGIVAAQQVGEHLVWVENDLSLRPVLAERWAPNEDGSEWSVLLYAGITTHDGTPLTAADVVAVLDAIPQRTGASPADRTLRDVLPPGGVSALDERSLVFRLNGVVSDFPYLLSQETPESLILPGAASGSWNGSGPFRLVAHDPGVRTTFVRNDAYWNEERAPLLDGVELVYLPDVDALLAALKAGEIDVADELAAVGARALFEDGSLVVLNARTSAHRQVHMRVDTAPFDDVRVRQAVALLVDRDALLETLLDFQADTGNDSPTAPVFTSTDPDVPQRARDVEEAKRLLQAAGQPSLQVTLTVPQTEELPALGEALAQQLAEGGIQVEVELVERDAYVGTGAGGSPTWLEVPFGIIDHPHRATANTILAGSVASDGAWNAAHYASPVADDLVGQFEVALTDDQRLPLSGELQRQLLEDTPMVVPYFPSALRAASVRVIGVEASPYGALDLTQATLA